MTATHSAPPSGRADHGNDHDGDRQTFELYGRRITHINNRDVQQLLAAVERAEVEEDGGIQQRVGRRAHDPVGELRGKIQLDLGDERLLFVGLLRP